MKFGGVEMPVTQGYDKKDGVDLYVTRANFHVSGILPDGRVFEIWINEGGVFDGASVPRALWRLCGHPMSLPRMAAALPHDWLYRAKVCDREIADLIYRTIERMAGIGDFNSGVEYKSLRWFGDSAWDGWKDSDAVEARARGALVLEGETMKGIEL